MKCLICDAEFKHISLKRHLSKEHDLSVAEYYLKYVLETDEIPKCLHCGGDSKFIKYSRGYSIYCSKNCRSKHTIGRLNRDPEFQRLAREGQIKAHRENPDKAKRRKEVAIQNINKFNNRSTLDKISSSFLSGVKKSQTYYFDNTKPLLLYLVVLTDSIKVGVTQDERKRRNVIPNRIYGLTIGSGIKGDYSVSLLISGSVDTIFDLESRITMTFKHQLNHGFEYFKKEALDDILKFINDNISSSTTIETLDVDEINKALQSKE
nr:MAG TPA: ROS/MUCR transcriptional regulator protein [Caudoviricetes sp.]